MSAAWIAPFLEAQAAELNAAENTLLAYGRDLTDANDWLAARGLGFDTATRADLESYLIALDAQGLARSTRARRLSSLKQIYRFAYEDGLRDDNPALQIKGPGRDKALPKTRRWRRSTGCYRRPKPMAAAQVTGCATPV